MDPRFIRSGPQFRIYVIRNIELADTQRFKYRRMACSNGIDDVVATTDESQVNRQNAKHDFKHDAIINDVPFRQLGFRLGDLLDMEQPFINGAAIRFKI